MLLIPHVRYILRLKRSLQIELLPKLADRVRISFHHANC